MTGRVMLSADAKTVTMKGSVWSQVFPIKDINSKIQFHEWMAARPKASSFPSEILKGLERVKKIAANVREGTT